MSASAEPRALLRELFGAALAAVDADAAVARALGSFPLGELAPARCSVLALGKAAIGMARAWHRQAGSPRAGLAVAREPGELPAPWRVLVGGHPLPSEASVRAGQAALDFCAAAPADDTLVALLSGGTSALLSAPCPGVPLADLRTATELLLRSGAEIGELNCVRKHLTCASGGRLAEAARTRAIVVLAISDVLGDDFATLGSGPFAPDPTTFEDALCVLRARGCWSATPASVRGQLERGAAGELAETPKPGAAVFARVSSRVIASNASALEAAARAASARGLAVTRLEAALRGEARDVGAELAARALALRGAGRRVLIAGGETTVLVRGDGRGGRCQELALGAARVLAGERGVALLAAGTDGSDGPTAAAGAFADGATLARGRAVGAEAEDALARNDSHAFFAREGGLFAPGATGTNALDVVLVLVEPRS